MIDVTARRRALARFAVTALGLVVVGVAGYLGFVAFAGGGREAAAGVLVLAAGTGFAAFFSPCSFPLLLTHLTRRSSESATAALTSALRVALGAALLLALIGAVIALGGSGIAEVVGFDSTTGRAFRLAIGVLLIAVGLLQSHIWAWRMQWFSRIAGSAARVLDPSLARNPAGSDVRYGFGYLLAGFG